MERGDTEGAGGISLRKNLRKIVGITMGGTVKRTRGTGVRRST